MKKVVIGLYGGPSCGKTTAASSIYAKLKRLDLNVEMAPEIAKEFVLEENTVALQYQMMIWANQCYRIYSAYRHAQIVITDAPILLGAIYNENASPALINVIFEEYHKFNNINIIVPRQSIKHSMIGRMHSLTESISIDNQILRLLVDHNIPFTHYDITKEDELIETICNEIG